MSGGRRVRRGSEDEHVATSDTTDQTTPEENEENSVESDSTESVTQTVDETATPDRQSVTEVTQTAQTRGETPPGAVTNETEQARESSGGLRGSTPGKFYEQSDDESDDDTSDDDDVPTIARIEYWERDNQYAVIFGGDTFPVWIPANEVNEQMEDSDLHGRIESELSQRVRDNPLNRLAGQRVGDSSETANDPANRTTGTRNQRATTEPSAARGERTNP